MDPSNAYSNENRAPLGANGWLRVEAGETLAAEENTPHGVFLAVRALGEEATLGGACQAHKGDPPQQGDTLAPGEVRLYPLTQIDVEAGVVEVARG